MKRNNAGMRSLFITPFALFSFSIILALTMPAAHSQVVLDFTPAPTSVKFNLVGCQQFKTAVVLPDSGAEAINVGSPEGYVCDFGGNGNGDYVEGNLKDWNELDILPHRLIINNTGGDELYDTLVAADYKNFSNKVGAAITGYDVIYEPNVNEILSEENGDGQRCTITEIFDQVIDPNVTGGVDSSVVRAFTIDHPAGTTCVIDYGQRIAVGARFFPGSSLQSYQCRLADCSGANQTLSLPIGTLDGIPVSKDIVASQNTDYTWPVTKSVNPDSLDFGDTCDIPDDQFPVSLPVEVTVSTTKVVNPDAPDKVIITTRVWAKNVANIPLQIQISDMIFGDLGAGLVPLHENDLLSEFALLNPGEGAPCGDLDTCPPLATFMVMVDPPVTDITNIARLEALKDEFGNDIEVPDYAKSEESETQVDAGPIQEDQTNATATIKDTEIITGTGYTFASGAVTSNDGVTGAYVGYTQGTETTGPVVWESDPLSDSGSVTFSKTVFLASRSEADGILADFASSTTDEGSVMGATTIDECENDEPGDDNPGLQPFCKEVPLSARALVDLKINKTIPEIWDLSQGYLIFGFQIQDGDGPLQLDPADDINPEIEASADIPADVKAALADNDLVEILFEDGDGTSKSITLADIGPPGTYTIIEIDDQSADPDGTGLNDGGLVPDPDVPNPDRRTVTPNINDCGADSGVANFDNVLPPTGITVRATKSTIVQAADLPNGNPADGWTIWLRDASDDSIVEVGLTGAGDNDTGEHTYFLLDGTPIEVIPPGDYYFEERLDDQDPDFYLKSAIGTNTGANDGDKLCPFTIAYPQSLNTVYRCDITNELKGTITIIKETNPDGGQMFDFCQDIGDRGGDEQCETDVFKFSLDDDGQEQFLDLFPGDYNVSEPLNFDGTVVSNADFHFTNIVCEETDDSDGNGESGQVDATSAALIQLDPGEDVTCTWTNTEKGKVNLIKTYNGGTEFPDGVVFRFRLTGPDVNLNGNNPDDEAQAPPSLVEFLMGQDDPPLLKAGAKYKLCELDVQSGFSVEWSLEGQLLPQTDNQNAINEVYIEGGEGSTYCVNFIAEAGTLITYEVDNIDPPGGDPRTIGYWRNWSTCSGGKQAEKAAEDDTKWLLDDFVNSDYEPAITLGEGKTLGEQTTAGQPDENRNCLEARRVLMKRTTHAGNGQCGIVVNKNLAKDAAYRLAAQLLGTKLNIEAEACTISGLQTKIDEAESLLTDVGYDGRCRDIMSGKYSKNKDRLQEANELNSYFDSYNNGEFCGGGDDD